MSLDIIYLFSRWTHFTLLFIYTGCCFYSALLAPASWRSELCRRLSPLTLFSALGCGISAWLLLAIQVGLMGDGWQDILHVSVWQAVFTTAFGRMWHLQLWLPLLSVAALFIPRQAGRNMALVTALAQLCGLALVGHAAMYDGVAGTLQRINQCVHLTAAAFWSGGLVPLVMIMLASRRQRMPAEAISTLMRFSLYGHLAVALVLLSGIIDGWLLLDWPLWHFQRYSQLLAVKILLVLLMVALAVYNRYWLVPRFGRVASRVQRYFVMVTLLELLLAASVLMLVAIFATLPPG
ncbi:hypothetical protein BL250_05420 [Erwinia sp. OLTSP20]|uniref:copper homeostasis membrane protein CopD n=1 Tax=unclassified Erwinia TaxID=2622719 RepID=UPI000C19F99C|nr:MULTISPECIES: copper homeostasis membrane protein CopD [unclassified Erwinia]PIJ51465.1 hypothetical protein BV501_04255 [Erwinia sp. OAMSP11]PIJ73486.1 hypothetical protein BK416_07090 [Erwinia sp. OLSSP12]PIJ85549.1 hypothetical protein BLD47_00240 [Erwinia sp. OLCASP19]PIJ85947.1 hypothetical protein BLD46_05285 [Erwinia sp. OLMTSP26]PIJ87428.1 hypothetical protein BLD49_06310 [Erwinia sp. OLMDSP33]